MIQQIRVTAKSQKELDMRVADNLKRGWELVVEGSENTSVSQWDWDRSRKVGRYHGRDIRTKHIAIMRRSVADEVSG